MKTVYPAFISADGDKMLAAVPDLNIHTSGSDLADAIFMARDAIGLMCITLADMGQELPVPGKANFEPYDGIPADKVISTWIDVDLDEYRRKNDQRMVKKNCTIPQYLNYEAEKRGINFSKVLQEALRQKLALV